MNVTSCIPREDAVPTADKRTREAIIFEEETILMMYKEQQEIGSMDLKGKFEAE